MNGERILFIDRDGTLIEEPDDEQVDSLPKLKLMPGVIPALIELRDAGFRFVLVSNQDARHAVVPGSQLPRAAGFPACAARIPWYPLRCGVLLPAPCGGRLRLPQATDRLLMVLAERSIDRSAYVIGDRDTDLELAANLGLVGLRVRRQGSDEETWEAVARRLVRPPRRPGSTAGRARPRSRSRSISIATPVTIATGIAFFDHMLEQVARHGGLRSSSGAPATEIDEHHTVEDTALALGQALREALGAKRGIARYGFLLPMDEARAQIALDLSGRPTRSSRVVSTARRSAVCRPSWCSHSSDPGGQPGGIAHQRAGREHASHDRGLLQRRRARCARRCGSRARSCRAARARSRFRMEAVAIVDSGGATSPSLCYAFERLGVAARLTCDPREVRDAPRVILPGVGAAGRCDAAAGIARARGDPADADAAGARHMSRHAAPVRGERRGRCELSRCGSRAGRATRVCARTPCSAHGLESAPAWPRLRAWPASPTASTCTSSMVSPRRPVRAHSRPATTASSSPP